MGRVSRGAVLVASLITLAAAAGCGNGAGDGKLLDDWAPVAEAKPIIPPAGVCFDTANTTVDRISVTGAPKVACTAGHTVETFHVGQLPDVAASSTLPPSSGTEAYQQSFRLCETAAKDFLGDDWYNGRLYLSIGLPQAHQWEGGGRWFRCDLMEAKSQAGELVERTASLRDGLRGDRPVASGCYAFVNATEDEVEDLTPIDCAQPHDAEFAGVFEATGATPPAAGKAREDAGFAGCRAAVATFVGASGSLKVGYMYWGFDPDDWARGDKRVRCYATAPVGKKLKGTVKGIGNAAPPTA